MIKFFLTIVMSLVIIIGCSNNEPTAPELPEEAPIATEIIGSEGGILATEDFKFIVPGGAFEQSAELKLFIEETEPASENSISPIYRIEGIPQFYSQPLETSIKYVGELDGLILVQRGMEAEVSDVDTSFIDMVYELFETAEKNKFITTQFPAIVAPTKSLSKTHNSGNASKWFITVKNGCSQIVSYNFVLKSSDFNFNDNATLYQTIIDYFESALTRFKNLNFDVPESNNIVIPITKDTNPNNPPFRIIQNKWGGDIYIKMKDNPTIDDYRELYDYSYAIYFLLKYHTLYPDWPTEGICHWTRYKYRNTEIQNEVYDSFKTSLKSIDSKGLCSMIEFLVDTYGEAILSKIIKDMGPPDWKRGLTAIQENTALAKNWLTDYYLYLMTSDKWRERLQPKISGSPNFWTDLAASETLIESTTDEVMWTESYDNLSAKLFRVVLANNLDENSSLNFKIEGGDAKLSLLKCRNNNFEILYTSENNLTLSNIKQLAADGYELYALIANCLPNYPGNEKSDIKLTTAKIRIPKITNCSISIEDIDVNKRIYRDDGSYYDIIQERYWSHYNTASEPEPTFENNIFYQAYSFTDDQGFIKSGNFSVQFNDNLDSVLTFSVSHKEDKTFVDPRYGISEHGISGHDIPVVASYEKDTFEVTGMEACEKINDNIKGSQTGGGTSDWEIISINTCRPDSDPYPTRLWIKIYKE